MKERRAHRASRQSRRSVCFQPREMDLVVDIQCVMNANNTHVPKEVALLALADDYIGHWIVAPPYSAKKLPISVKSTNKWLSRNKHGLEWEDGYITRPALMSHLREICKIL